MYGISVTMKLQPFFWKSCRVIACETRLQLLWQIFEAGELTVTELRFLVEISQPNASNQLRSLSECGLIISRRSEMSVIYRPEANETVKFGQELLKALHRCYVRSEPFAEIIQQATAFTHQRRIEIVRALQKMPLDFQGLQDATGMSMPALSRHVNKLERRGFVKRTGKLISFGRPKKALGRKLMALALT